MWREAGAVRTSRDSTVVGEDIDVRDAVTWGLAMTVKTARPRSALATSDDALEAEPEARSTTLKRVALAGITAFFTINIWTGAPVLALWIGSQAVGGGQLSMAAVGVVILALAVLELMLLIALAWFNNIYDELTGRPRAERRASWLRSMRAEAEPHVSQRVGVTLLERIVVANVYIAVIVLLAWFVLFAPHVCVTQC